MTALKERSRRLSSISRGMPPGGGRRTARWISSLPRRKIARPVRAEAVDLVRRREHAQQGAPAGDERHRAVSRLRGLREVGGRHRDLHRLRILHHQRVPGDDVEAVAAVEARLRERGRASPASPRRGRPPSSSGTSVTAALSRCPACSRTESAESEPRLAHRGRLSANGAPSATRAASVTAPATPSRRARRRLAVVRAAVPDPVAPPPAAPPSSRRASSTVRANVTAFPARPTRSKLHRRENTPSGSAVSSLSPRYSSRSAARPPNTSGGSARSRLSNSDSHCSRRRPANASGGRAASWFPAKFSTSRLVRSEKTPSGSRVSRWPASDSHSSPARCRRSSGCNAVSTSPGAVTGSPAVRSSPSAPIPARSSPSGSVQEAARNASTMPSRTAGVRSHTPSRTTTTAVDGEAST